MQASKDTMQASKDTMQASKDTMQASKDTREPLPDHVIAESTYLICNGRAYPIDTPARAEHVGTALIADAEKRHTDALDLIGDGQ